VSRIEGQNSICIDLALIHHPVCNRVGEIIGSAVTNLDLHDIARAGRTFGVDTYSVVTPYEDQVVLVQEILDHWLTGYGASRNPDRKEALSIVDIRRDFDEVLDAATEKWGVRPTVLATCARLRPDTLQYEQARQRLEQGEPMLLLFGTAWGLAPEILSRVDGTLPPVLGHGTYNHLSVRSAVSIILDRLLGNRD